MSTPNNRRYTAAHVWVQVIDGQLLMGITEHAQESLGGIEHLELPSIDTEIRANLPCGTIESIKTASDLIAPLNARVVEHNKKVVQDPQLINLDPYEEGWLMRLADYNDELFHSLLDAEAYNTLFE